MRPVACPPFARIARRGWARREERAFAHPTVLAQNLAPRGTASSEKPCHEKKAHGMTRWFLALLLTALVHPALAVELTPERINSANFTGKLPSEDSISPLAVKLQVLLDRARFSPGEIDGRFGDNVEKALQAFAEANNLAWGKVLTVEIWSKLQQASSDAIIAEYVLTDKDIKGPYIEKLPTKMQDMKSLKALNYTGPKEALSEHFHMS